MSAIVHTGTKSGSVTYEKYNGSTGMWAGLTNKDVTSLAAVGLYAFNKHISRT